MSNTMKDVTFVEMPVYDMAIPLVSGYLQAYACKDSHLANTYRFHQYSVNYKISEQKIVSDLLNNDSDVYAFSCYVWNTALIRRVVAELMMKKPHAHCMLGGPQVMHHGHQYLDPRSENLFLCSIC